MRPLWRFLRMYVVRGGFLDGRRGLMIAWFSAFNVFLKYARLWDRLRREQSGAPPNEKRSTPSDEDPLLA